uniref:[histone H3]-lysine(36) N-trimethyltransferase n=1 Tax=Petromyzon marinus TaxID=7757 RepID=A0AAJ7WRR0_PETMA|nr:histone-lysine N-methyltransferase SETD2 isoform X2 [Petromyzon marinus]
MPAAAAAAVVKLPRGPGDLRAEKTKRQRARCCSPSAMPPPPPPTPTDDPPPPPPPHHPPHCLPTSPLFIPSLIFSLLPVQTCTPSSPFFSFSSLSPREDDIELSPEPTPSVPVQSRPTPGLQAASLQAPQRTGAVRNSKIDLKNKSRQKICFSIAPNKILKLRPLAIANEAENLWEEKNLSLSTQEGSDMNAPSTSSQAPAVGSEGDLPSPDAQLSQSFTPPKEFKIEWNKMHYKKAHLIGNVARSVDQKPDGANAGGVDVSGGDDETSKAVVNTEAAETGDKLVLAEISSDSELTPVQPVSSVVIAAEIIVKDTPDATELTLTTKESNSQQTGNAQKSGQIIEVLQNSERCKIVSYRNIKVDVQSQKVKRKASRWDIPKDAEKPVEQTIDSPLNKDALSSNVLAPKTSDSLVGTMQSCLPTTVVDASIIDESKEAVLDSEPEHKTASVASACSDVISSSQFKQPTQVDVISQEMCVSIEKNNDTSLNQPVQFQMSTENDVPPEPHVSVTESPKCNEEADDEKDMTESCSSHSLSASRMSSPTGSVQADPTLPSACSMDDESTHKSDTESDSEDESDGEYRYPRVKLQSVVVVPATSLAAAAEGDGRTLSIVHQSDSSSKDSSDVDEMHKTSDKVTESDSTDGSESPKCQPTNDEVAEHHLDSSKADTEQTSENKEMHGVDVEELQNKQDKGTCEPDENNDTVEKSQEQDHVELEKEINKDDLEDTEMADASDDVTNVEHTSVIDYEKTTSIIDKETVHVNEISPTPCVTKQTLDVENKELDTLEVNISTPSGENGCSTPAADEKHVGQSTEVVIESVDTSGNDPSVVKSESIDIVDEAQIDPLQTSNIGTLSHPISEKCQENKDDSKIVKSQTQEVCSKDGLEMQHKSVSKSDTKSEKQETSCKVLGTVEKTNVQGSSKERSERSGDGKQGSRDVSSRQRNSLDRQRKSQDRSSGQSKAQESVSHRGSSKEKSDAHRRSDRSRSRDCTERSRDRVRKPSRSREHASRRSRSRNRMEKRSRSRERASRRSRSRNRSDRSRDRQERRSRSKDRPERRSRSKNRSDRLRDWPDRRSRSRDRSDRRSRSRDRLDRRSRSRNRSDKVRDVVDRRSRSRGRARRSRERVERRSRSRDRSDRRSRSRDRTERLDKRSRSRDRTDRRGRFIERTRGRSRDRTDRRSHSRDRNLRAHSKERGGGGGRSRSRDRSDRHTSFRSERRQSPTHHEPSKTSSQSSQNHSRDAPEKRDSGDKSGHPTSSSCSNSAAENRHSSHKTSESSSSKQHSASGVSDRKSMEEKSSSHMTTKQEGSYKTQSWVPESRHAPHQEQTGAKTNSGPAFDTQSGLLKSHESSHQQINNPTQQAGNMLMQPDRWSTTKPNQDFFINSQNVCQYSEVAYQFNTPYCQADFPVNHISQDELYYNQQLGLNMINMHFQHGPGMAGGNALLAGQAHPHQGPMPFNQQMLHSAPSNNFAHKTLLPNPRGNNLEVPSLIKEVPSLIKTEKPNSDLELSSKRDKSNENEQDSNKQENENNFSRDTAKKEVKDESKLQQGKTPKTRRRRVISDSESDSETDFGDAKLDGTTDGETNKQTEVFEELNWPMENFEDAAKWKAMAAEGRMPSYFDILGENHYLSERKKSKSHRDIKKMKCECSMSEEEREQGLVACGEDCLNRLLMIECSSRCPTGELCTNRRFQKREYAKVEVFKTDKKGWGLRTSVDLQAGTFVLEYCGEVLDYKEFKTRAKEYARNKNIHFYFMALKNEEIIDATLKGNCSRFMNHSCDPNCETQKWTVNGQLRVGFFSRRLVPAGTELTFDYQFQRYGKEAQKCFCGSANCRGVLGGENRTSVRSSVGKGQRAKEKDRARKKDSLDEELESLQESGEGLTHQRDVLCLLRLMVRTETMEQRHTCLQILQNTQSQACLKHFLEYHGLPLLWSWMAEAGDIRGISSTIAKLQIEIIKTLQHLPIPNRTILEKSKVLGVIERWASCSPGLAPAAEVDGYSSENASQAMSARNSPAPLELSRSQELRKTLDATSIAGSPVQSEAGRAADVVKPTDQGQGKAPDGSKAMDGSLKTRLYRRLKLFNESSTDSVASDVSKVSDGEEEPKDVAEVEVEVKGQEAVGGEPQEEKIESDEKEPKEELEQKVEEVEKVENEEIKVKEEKEEAETLQPEEQTEVKEVKEEVVPVPEEENEKEDEKNPVKKEEMKDQGETLKMEVEVGEETPPQIVTPCQEKELAAVENPETSAAPEQPSEKEDCAENVDTLAIAPVREIGSHDEEEAGSDVESERSQEPDHHSPVTIAQLAVKLLHSWKDLKEVYRIPKKSRPKSDHGRKAHGRDGTSSRDRESTSRDSGDKRSTPRERDREKRKVQTPSSSYDKLGVKRQHSAERYDPDLGTPAKRKPPPPPNGPKLTTEERRRLFEQRAAEEEAQKQVVFMQQQQAAAAAAMAAAGLFQPCDTNFMTSYSPQVQQQQAFQPGYAHGYAVHPHLEQSQHVNARKVLVCYEQDPSVMQVAQDPMDLTRVEALSQPLPVVMQQIQQQQLQQLQQQQLQQQLLQQQLQQQQQQQQYPNAQDTATLLAMDPAILPAAMAGGVQVQATAAGWDAAYAAIPQQYVAAGQPQQTIVYQAQAVPQQQPAYTAATQFAQQQSVQATYVQTGAGYVQQGQQYYPATAQPVVQAAPGAPAVAVAYQQPIVMETVQQPTQTAMIATCNVMELPPPSPPKPKVISLPPNWRTATDQEGKIYYYHVVSRVTQWDPPAWEGDSDEVGGDRESEMDLGTPTYDETPTKASKKPKTAEADTSSELAKKNKETFRKELSQLIVHCLNAFRKPDCKIGKITNTEDFKYLARKLTHGVMSKEMKLCRNPEDLECNENVKHKTKEYIKKYMTKFGAVYKPKDEPADPE